MSTTPQQVEPGQVWRDKDERSKGAGEFTVRAIPGGTVHNVDRRLSVDDERFDRTIDWCEKAAAHGLANQVAICERAGGYFTRIRVDRLLKGRDYEYIGRQR